MATQSKCLWHSFYHGLPQNSFLVWAYHFHGPGNTFDSQNFKWAILYLWFNRCQFPGPGKSPFLPISADAQFEDINMKLLAIEISNNCVLKQIFEKCQKCFEKHFFALKMKMFFFITWSLSWEKWPQFFSCYETWKNLLWAIWSQALISYFQFYHLINVHHKDHNSKKSFSYELLTKLCERESSSKLLAIQKCSKLIMMILATYLFSIWKNWKLVL